jgi:hypothetical protein
MEGENGGWFFAFSPCLQTKIYVYYQRKGALELNTKVLASILS